MNTLKLHNFTLLWRTVLANILFCLRILNLLLLLLCNIFYSILFLSISLNKFVLKELFTESCSYNYQCCETCFYWIHICIFLWDQNGNVSCLLSSRNSRGAIAQLVERPSKGPGLVQLTTDVGSNPVLGVAE